MKNVKASNIKVHVSLKSAEKIPLMHANCIKTATLAITLLVLSSTGSAELRNRWSSTATNGGGLVQGDATTLTWSIVRDGTPITAAFSGESNDPSSLINFLDTIIGAGPGGDDLTLRPWFFVFNDSFNRMGQVSGLTYVYEANDDGARIDGSASPFGQIGVRGDVRIGGHSIDGQSGGNTLAYNYFPNHGDMVIDTDNSNFYDNTGNNRRGFRNVVMHEAGHGVGLEHVTSNNSGFLMEPSIQTSFDGPQFDDIRILQRGYGDVYEKGGGNDVAANATDLGVLKAGETISIGDDAADKVVANTETDFISIDDDSDTDFLSITLNTMGFLDLVLNPLGPTYNLNGSDFNAMTESDLTLALFDTDGSTLLGLSNNTGLGGSESLMDVEVGPGTYFARITGAQNDTQFYQLQASFTAVPEPGTVGSLAFIALVTGAYRWRRRRKQA